MRNDIDKVTRIIVVIFPVLWLRKREGTATCNVYFMMIDSPLQLLCSFLRVQQTNENKENDENHCHTNS
jgi:hypothetical protein